MYLTYVRIALVAMLYLLYTYICISTKTISYNNIISTKVFSKQFVVHMYVMIFNTYIGVMISQK